MLPELCSHLSRFNEIKKGMVLLAKDWLSKSSILDIQYT